MSAPTDLHAERRNRRAFTASDVCAAAGITYRQLDYWTRTDLVTASGHPSTGHGDARWYRDDDVVRVATVATLLKAGISLAAIRQHIDQLLDDGLTFFDDTWTTITVDLTGIRQRIATYRRAAS